VNRQNLIFVSLVIILAVALVTAGYATGRGPLGLINYGISRLTSGSQMIPTQTLLTENKAPVAPEISGGRWINSDPPYASEPARSRGADRVLDVRLLQLPQYVTDREVLGHALS